MNDKWPLVASKEYGVDEDSTVGLLKNHEAVTENLDQFKPQITELGTDSQKMISSKHYESKVIKSKQVSTE